MPILDSHLTFSLTIKEGTKQKHLKHNSQKDCQLFSPVKTTVQTKSFIHVVKLSDSFRIEIYLRVISSIEINQVNKDNIQSAFRLLCPNLNIRVNYNDYQTLRPKILTSKVIPYTKIELNMYPENNKTLKTRFCTTSTRHQ